MALDGRTYPLADDQPQARTIARLVVTAPPDVNDDVGLRHAHPVFHRLVEFSRPPHAVACGKHRKTRYCDQADSARRPLRRRPDTIARPARVRIRKRKPCTRARRRLFGWKVRLPLATAFSLSFSGRIRPKTSEPSGRSCFASTSVGGGLAAGRRGPHAQEFWVAAVSPTFGRLFEGTDERSLGQTWPEAGSAPTDPLEHCVNVRHRNDRDNANPSRRPRSRKEPRSTDLIATERLAAGRKTVSFSQCRFRLERRSTTKRGWRID
jgi:hypothetical protein